MTKRVRRLTVVAAMALALAGGTGVLPTGPEAEAHTCAEVRIHKGGSTDTIGDCHEPPCPPDDHVGNAGDVRPGGTGVGWSICVG